MVPVEPAVVDIGVVAALVEFLGDRFLLRFHHLDIILQAFLLQDISLVFLVVDIGAQMCCHLVVDTRLLEDPIDSVASVLEHPIVSEQELSIVLGSIVEEIPMVALLV